MASKAPRPTMAETAALKVCPNCGGHVERKSARGPSPTFCSSECKRAKGNRDLARGSTIIVMAQAWRINRGSGSVSKAALQELCAILDRYNAEDREAGRPRADVHAAKMLNSGYSNLDRRRA